MVTITDIITTGIFSTLIKYSSDLETPTFYIYLDGNLIDQTAQTEYKLSVNLDESSIIEILDDPEEKPIEIFPNKIKLNFFCSQETSYYKIDEYIESEWLTRQKIKDNSGYMSFESRFLEDCQSHIFRIIPVGTDGNEGESRQFTVLCCRYPDVPAVDYEYEKIEYYKVTGELTPDSSGNYFYAGQKNGKPYYRRDDGAFFLWWNIVGISWWVINTNLDVFYPWWTKQDDQHIITGSYNPYGGYTGIATVSAEVKGRIKINE